MKSIINTYKSRIAYLIVGCLSLAAGLYFLVTASYAQTPKCFGQYGEEIACPILNRSFTIEIFVRPIGSDNWFGRAENVRANNELEFQLLVKNTGEVETDGVLVINSLPDNLELSGGQLSWTLDDFMPLEERTVTFKARANSNGIEQGQEKCVVDTAAVELDNRHMASDTVEVCIQNPAPDSAGEVLAVSSKELPATAVGQIELLGLSLVILQGGLIVWVLNKIWYDHSKMNV